MSPERDPLEDLLVSEPYLDDAGFTERVMGMLPGRRRDPRPLVLGISGAVAAVLAALFLPDALRDAALALGAAFQAWPAWLGIAPALGTALLAAAAAAAAVAALALVEVGR